MKFCEFWLWPLTIFAVLAALSFGRLLENDNELADHGLSQAMGIAQR